MTTNEAAERLHTDLWDDGDGQDPPVYDPERAVPIIVKALAAERLLERQATVERIVQRWHDAEQYREGGSHPNSTIRGCGICSAVLDEEAA
jgi:hypothetical protein